MFIPQVIENIQEFQCHEKHNKPVFAIRLDQNISNEKRLYCKECSNLNDIKFIPLTKVVQLSTDSIEKTLQKFKNLFDPLYELLLKFQQSISQLKSLLFSILNELETITSDWISCIQATGQQMSKYNLFDELDKLINNQRQTEYQNDEKIMKEYKNLYIKHLTKVNSTLKQFKGFSSKILDCFKIIKEISNKNQECQLQPISDQNILPKSPYQSSQNSLSNATSLELSQKVTQRTFQYQFELLNQSYQEQNECNAFAINHNNTILLAALNNASLFSIKIMQMSYWQEIQQLNQKESLTLKVIQILEGNHENFVTTLNFFSSTPMRDSFISGSSDTTIIIWSTFIIKFLNIFRSVLNYILIYKVIKIFKNFCTKQNPKQLFWNPLIKLFGHQSIVLCLVLHHEENLFISGSSDYSIKFWSSSNQQQWSCQQTIEEHTDQVYGLSLNDAGNQVISCGNDKQILVIEGINNKEWHVKQKIQIQQIGFRLSFITSKLFAFQPSSQAFLQFYELNSIGVFVKTKILQIKGVDQCCDCFFPSVYIPLKGVMLSKNGQNLNIIQFSFGSQDWDCKLQQAIEFETQKFLQGRTYGTISPNGNFIVTWDVKSKEIQIRQYRTMT